MSLNPFKNAISPLKEIAAYEALWDEEGASFKTISEKFSAHPKALPSDLVKQERVESYMDLMRPIITDELDAKHFGVRINGMLDYPSKLRDAKHPIELLYFQGHWDLIYNPGVAVVGTRNPTQDGINRTKKLVGLLVKDGFTIISGLAKGVDSIAHKTAIDSHGNTIAVIGTPLNAVYPKENTKLQNYIKEKFLLISQVPFHRYSKQGPNINKFFFPERNKLMSALSVATIIVEAAETSGTLVQARAALEQGRKLFILNNNFENKNLTWPAKYLEKGAIKVTSYQDITEHLKTL